MNANAKAALGALVAVGLVVGLGLALLGEEEGPDDDLLGGSSATPRPTAGASPGERPGVRPSATPGGRATPRPSPDPGGAPTPGLDPGGPGPGPAGTPRRTGDLLRDRTIHSRRELLPGQAALQIICLDQDGSPLAGVRIEARRKSGAPLEAVDSDGRGQATLEPVAEGEALRGTARHPRCASPVSFGPIAVQRGESIRLRFVTSVLGTLVGRIVDEAGQPVSEAELVLFDPRSADGEATLDSGSMRLNPDGSFAAPVAAGSYSVAARGKGLSESDRAYVTVEADAESEPVELVVMRQGSIAGRLILPPDLQTQLPLELDLVMEIERGTAANPYTRTDRRPLGVDSTLNFRLEGCDPGKYRVRLEVPAEGGPRVGAWNRFVLQAGEQREGLVFELREARIAMRGTIRDDVGNPVADAIVSANAFSATTDRDGRFTLRGLDPGDVSIKVEKEGYAPAFQRMRYESRELHVEMVLPRSGGVRGRVRAQQGSVARIPVLIVLKQDDAVQPYQTTTDDEGNYQLDGLVPGTYYLKAGHGADPFDEAGAPTLRVSSGQVVEAPAIILP